MANTVDSAKIAHRSKDFYSTSGQITSLKETIKKEAVSSQAHHGDKKILKMKRSAAGKQAAKAGPHLSKKHGIK